MTCGECKHGQQPEHDSTVMRAVFCQAPAPLCTVGGEWDRWMLETTNADDCPCFERKEEK